MGRFEIVKLQKLCYTWRLVDKDGIRMESSRTYLTRTSARRGIRRFAKLASSAPVTVVS